MLALLLFRFQAGSTFPGEKDKHSNIHASSVCSGAVTHALAVAINEAGLDLNPFEKFVVLCMLILNISVCIRWSVLRSFGSDCINRISIELPSGCCMSREVSRCHLNLS